MLVDKYPWLFEPTLLTMVIRSILAIICAGAIGFDRNRHGASAGLRTHILVCIGAMLAMTVGQFSYIHYGAGDPTRIGAQVVSGIGFLGAGSIIVTRNNKVSGLTTAAGLWGSACIGLAIGIGFYEGAIIGAVAVFFTERALRGFSKSLIVRKRESDTDHNEQNGVL